MGKIVRGCGSIVVDVVKRVPVFTVGDKTKIVDVEGRSKQLVAGGVTLNNIVWSCQLVKTVGSLVG